MDFSVKYRKPDGALEEIVVEAESRAAVFPLLEKRGIKAIRIDEATLKRNRKNQVNGAKGSRSAVRRFTALRGIVAGALAVALAIGGYFVFFDSSERLQEPVVAKGGTIKEVNSAKVAPKPVAEAPKPKVLTDEEKRKNEIARLKKIFEGQEMPKGIKAKIYYLENPPKSSYEVMVPHEYLAHHSERSIANVVLVEPGTEFLDVLTFGSSFNDDFVNALVDKIEINSEDDEETRRVKENVTEVKREIARICKEEGKKPNEVMNEYAKLMYDLGKFDKELRRELSEKRRNPNLSDEDVQDFFHAANVMREQRGLQPLVVPSLAKRAMMLTRQMERASEAADASNNE